MTEELLREYLLAKNLNRFLEFDIKNISLDDGTITAIEWELQPFGRHRLHNIEVWKVQEFMLAQD